MGEKKLALASVLRRVLKRFRILLRRKVSHGRRRASKWRRSLSLNDRPMGLLSCFGDERMGCERSPIRRLDRVSSLNYGNVEDDIDRRSQIFIDNFRRRLWLEKQVSLQLRYYRVDSFRTEDQDNSPCSSSEL